MNRLDITEEFRVCFGATTTAESFKKYVVDFALNKRMRVIDRSAEAEQELRDLDHGKIVLDKTVGPLILVTIEKNETLRISLTNAALGKDLKMAFRYRTKSRPPEAARLLEFAKKNYSVIRVTGQAQDTCLTGE